MSSSPTEADDAPEAAPSKNPNQAQTAPQAQKEACEVKVTVFNLAGDPVLLDLEKFYRSASGAPDLKKVPVRCVQEALADHWWSDHDNAEIKMPSQENSHSTPTFAFASAAEFRIFAEAIAHENLSNEDLQLQESQGQPSLSLKDPESRKSSDFLDFSQQHVSFVFRPAASWLPGSRNLTHRGSEKWLECLLSEIKVAQQNKTPVNMHLNLHSWTLDNYLTGI